MQPFIATSCFLLIGLVLRRVASFPADASRVLNAFVIHVSLPALVLLNIPKLSFEGNLFVPVLMPWMMLLVSAAAVLLLGRILRWERGVTGSLMLLVPLGNTSFLGIPMVRVFFGDEGIPFVLLYDQLGSFLALATYGSLVLAVFDDSAPSPTPRQVLRKIATFPPFLSLLLALGLRTIRYPEVMVYVLDVLAATLVPLVMIAVGLQLQLRMPRQVLAQMGAGLSVKLVLAPAVAYVICAALGWYDLAAQVAIFEAAMPPMISAGALAISANLAPTLTAAMVGIGIVLSFGTLPLWHYFVQLLGSGT